MRNLSCCEALLSRSRTVHRVSGSRKAAIETKMRFEELLRCSAIGGAVHGVELAASAAADCAPALWPVSCCTELVLSAAADCARAGWPFLCCGRSSSASGCTPAPRPFLEQTVSAYLHCAVAICFCINSPGQAWTKSSTAWTAGCSQRAKQRNLSSEMQINAERQTSPTFVGCQNLVMHAAVKQHKAAPHWGNHGGCLAMQVSWTAACKSNL